jgi:hypothetical protein
MEPIRENMYDGNGRGPLHDSTIGAIGDNYVLYKCNNICYAFIENRIEVYTQGPNDQWVLDSCELLY